MRQQETGAFIAKKRKEKNLTQEQLAERLGISNKTVSKWENGKCMPDYSIIESLCKELNINLSELLSGKEKDAENETRYTEEQVALLLQKTEQLEMEKKQEKKKNITTSVQSGITFGTALAMIISYVNWHSIGWAILHGILSWGYVIYYWIRY